VQLFVLDSDEHDPDLQYVNATTPLGNSIMGQWLKNALAASTAPWKIVIAHHSPYSSSSFHGNSTWMQWPYQQWGANAVLTGHDHHYERIVKNNLPYFVNGVGGASLRPQYKPTPEAGSAIRYGSDYGAMKVDASDTVITFRLINRAGATIDTYTLDKTKPPPPPPAGLPAAPTNLTATSSTTETGTINLRWTDNATNESGYKVERSTDGRNFYPLSGTGVNGTSSRNTGLTAGRLYYYRVYAWNAVGTSDYSNVASAVAGQAGTPTTPAPPSGLAASAVSTSQINLTWSDNATNETGYRVERSTNGTTWSLFSNLGVNRNSVSVTGLTANTKYFFRVQALGSSGNSGWSNTASATTLSSNPTPGTPAAPTILSVAASTTVAKAINVSWRDNATNESGYKIERSTDGSTFVVVAGGGINSNFYRDINLTAGKRYYYRIYAWNASGNSARSAVMSAVALATATGTEPPPPPPPSSTLTAPSLLSVVASASIAHTLNLSWRDNSSNESGFKIERSTDGNTFYALTGTSANSTFQRDSNLTAGKRYYYRVYAWNSTGTSAFSNVISAIAP
jgi:titin